VTTFSFSLKPTKLSGVVTDTQGPELHNALPSSSAYFPMQITKLGHITQKIKLKFFHLTYSHKTVHFTTFYLLRFTSSPLYIYQKGEPGNLQRQSIFLTNFEPLTHSVPLTHILFFYSLPTRASAFNRPLIPQYQKVPKMGFLLRKKRSAST
jgi:hypothetical protein